MSKEVEKTQLSQSECIECRFPHCATEQETLIQELQTHQAHLQKQNQELHYAATEAERQRSRFESLFSSSPIPYMITTTSGKIKSYNQKALETLYPGITRGSSEFLNRGIHAEQLPQLFDHLYAARHGRGSQSCVLTWQLGPKPLSIQFHSNYLGDSDEILIALVDVTGQEEHRNSLKEAKAAAERANEIKSQFLANMTHEIRTPLTSILGYIELIGDNLKSKKLPYNKRYFQRIEESGAHLLHIVNDVLDLSKIESGHMEFRPTTFSIKESLEEIVAFIQPRATQKKLQLSLTIAKNTPSHINTDLQKLRQILLNLLSNAVKFTEKGSIHLGVDWLPNRTQEEGQLRFRIKDTGCGIRATHTHELFKSFCQLTSKDGRIHDGTGLGLVISQKLARMMRGDVILESTKEGVGSTFLAAIQAKRADINSETQIEKKAKEKAKEKAPTPRLSLPSDSPLAGVRILLAEDNSDLQVLFSSFLEIAGAVVDIVSDGLRAVGLVLENPYNIILIDMQMPILNGYEAVHLLREQLKIKEIPIVALTAHTLQSEKQKCFDLGCNDFLAKPPNTRLLIKRVAQNALQKPWSFDPPESFQLPHDFVAAKKALFLDQLLPYLDDIERDGHEKADPESAERHLRGLARLAMVFGLDSIARSLFQLAANLHTQPSEIKDHAPLRDVLSKDFGPLSP